MLSCFYKSNFSYTLSWRERYVQPFCLLSFELEHKHPGGGSKFLFSYWLLNVSNYGVFCFLKVLLEN